MRKLQDTIPLERRYTFEELNILTNLIMLWNRYAIWTRSLMISTFLDLPQNQAVRKRLYDLPIEFYNTLRVFFGERIAQEFLGYFQKHLVIQAQLNEALANEDQDAAGQFTMELYRNADEIASFLGQFPYWEEALWKQYLYNDIALYLQEARAYLTGDFEREIEIYERILLNATDIGEYMTRGILGIPD
ncbi:MAG: hypothetical protein K0Q48_2032 [Bacillota bacterium]|nr:hypothetical protein [Bacillota bacterium]